MKTIKMTEILEYYDGILLFVAQDEIGGHYVGNLVESKPECNKYAVVGVKPQRLDDFQTGQIDLRTLMLEMPTREWFTATTGEYIDDPRELVQQQEPLENHCYLPKPGHFLHCQPPEISPKVIRALELGSLVSFAGQLERASLQSGKWRLRNGSEIKKGRTYPGGPDLNGLTIGDNYTFTCAAVNEPDNMWRDRQVLYLQKIIP